MKSNNFPLKAIALAVSLAMVPSVHAQTDVTIDATTITSNNPGDINNQQNSAGDVTAAAADDVVIGTTVIDGVTGGLDIDVNNNSVELLAAGNGLLLSEGDDVSALGATINEIEIPVGSTDNTQAISSGQLTQGSTSAIENNALTIGTSLSGVVGGAIDVDVNASTVQLSSQANAVDNLIQGDLSAATGSGSAGDNGPNVRAIVNDVEARVNAGSDLSIANGQFSTGTVISNLGPSAGLIGVELSDSSALNAAGAITVDVNATALVTDAGANEATNQFNVVGGGAFSRNIANAQDFGAGGNVDADINGVDVGLINSDVTAFGSTFNSAVNSTSAAADADGNDAVNQILVDLNAVNSNQETRNRQVARNGATTSVTADVANLNIGLNQSANIDGDSLSVEALSSDIDATANSNSATNNISLQGIASGAFSDARNVQSGNVDSSADIANVAVGITSSANLPEIDLDVSSTQINATSGFNDATTQILLGGIANDTTNALLNTQNSGQILDVNAGVQNVSVGLATTGSAITGGGSVTNTIDVLATQIEASARSSNAVNNINSSQGADDSTNSIANTQASVDTVGLVDTATIGASFSGLASSVTAPASVATNTSALASSAQGSMVDNDITLVGTGSASSNNLASTQTASGVTDADASALNIGLLSNAAGLLTFGGDVSVEALSNSVSVDATAASANNRVAIGQIAIDSVNTVDNTQVVNAASIVSADATDIAIGVEAAGAVGTTFAGASGVNLDVSSSTVSTNASGTQATNQILFTGIAGNTNANVNTLGNDQDVNSNVTSATTFTNFGLSSPVTAGTLTAPVLDVTTLANSASSASDANSAINSINSLGSLENSVNQLSNNQDVGAAIQVISLTSSTTTGVSSAAETLIAGGVTVSASSNSATSNARVSTAINAITVADSGSAVSSDNDIVNAQATGAGAIVTSRVGRTDIGLFLSNVASTVGDDVTVSTNTNTLASAATVNTAVNTINPAGIADTSNNEIDNDQTVLGSVSSTAGLAGGSATAIINIGVSSAVADGGLAAGTFLIDANSNRVLSSANGNVGLNTISNDTSSQTSVNLITSDQVNTGNSTAITNELNIGADVDTVGDAGTFTLIANANEVLASIGLNSVNNIIGLRSLAAGTDNDIANTQTATLDADTVATVDDVNLGATTSEVDPLIAIETTVQNNALDATTVANSALNIIEVDNLGNNAGADIVNTQSLAGAFILGSALTNADIGLTFSAGVTSSADLVAQVSGNDLFANTTGNTAINTVSTTILGGGVGNASNANIQSITNTTISAQVGIANIGVTGAGSIVGVVGDVTVGANNNRVGAVAIANAAVNRITGL